MTPPSVCEAVCDVTWRDLPAYAATQQAAADILAAFLTGPPTGAASDVAATAARYPDVLGGAVQHTSAGMASAPNH